MHEASRSVRRWLKQSLATRIIPVAIGKQRKAETEVKNPVVWTKRRKDLE